MSPGPPLDRPAERALAALGYGVPRAHRGPGWAAAALSIARPSPRALAQLLRDVAALAATPDPDPRRSLVVPIETVVRAAPDSHTHVCVWASVADAVGPGTRVRTALAFGPRSGGAVAATLYAQVPRVAAPFSAEPLPIAWAIPVHAN